MKKRMVLFALLAMVGMLLALTAVVWARARVVGGPEFSSNGDLIVGWHWLRTGGQSASWTFNAAPIQGAKVGSVYLNFAPLCTNGVNGGSGYGTSCKLVIKGAKTITITTSVVNPFRPTDPQNSGGIGYQCYATSVSVPSSVWKGANTLKVTVSYPFSLDRHLAVNAGAMNIGYSK